VSGSPTTEELQNRRKKLEKRREENSSKSDYQIWPAGLSKEKKKIGLLLKGDRKKRKSGSLREKTATKGKNSKVRRPQSIRLQREQQEKDSAKENLSEGGRAVKAANWKKKRREP